MVQDTNPIDHRCGAVLDYCIYDNETYFFCSVCKEVVAIMSVELKSFAEFKPNEYSEQTKKENA